MSIPINNANLFLLEFIVEYVHLDYKQHNLPFVQAETCVTFNFLNNGPVYIREEEFKNNTGENDYIKFGKSCLFSLSPPLNNFDIDVNVYKIMNTHEEQSMVPAARTTVPAIYLYQQLVSDMHKNKSTNGVTSKYFKSVFDLMNGNYEPCGQICLFVRLSAFGKVLVTNFQVDVAGDTLGTTFENKEDVNKQDYGLEDYNYGDQLIHTNGNNNMYDAEYIEMFNGNVRDVSRWTERLQ